MTYAFSTTQNNGRIVSSSDAVTGENVSYAYDSLNRLIAAATTNTSGVQWGDSYTYDGFGNLTSKVSTNRNGKAPSVTPQVNPANNQARVLGDYGFDANGNWLGVPESAPLNSIVNTYNVENQLISTGTGDGFGDPLTYTYDPWGKRVLQASASSTYGPTGTLYFYSITGQRLATYQFYAGPPFSVTQVAINQFFGGRMLLPMDRLGSVRNNASGNKPIAYYPWGEERTTTSDGTDKFATYFRDLTNNGVGEDYASARYNNNNFGRFWSPDPAGVKGANPTNPTTWNRYAYANDDPVNRYDPAGRMAVNPGNPSDPIRAPGSTNGQTYNSGPCPYNPITGETGWAGWGMDPSGGEDFCSDPTDDSNPTGSCNSPSSYLLGGGASGGCGGSGSTPPPSCGNANSQAFVSTNFAAAAQAATTLGISGAVGDADILALSALESGWGTFKNPNGTTAYPGAWFGMQGVKGAPSYAGETACATIPGSTKTCEMEFSSFGAAAAVFATNEAGKVQGVSNPTAFFTNLKSVFAVGTPLAAYLKLALPTQAWIQSCLKTLGLAQ